MDHGIFTVYDTKAGAFLQPFFSKNLATAARAFTDAVRDPDTQFFKHPEDYTLFHLGTFDDAEGRLSMLPTADHVISGINVVRDEATQKSD